MVDKALFTSATSEWTTPDDLYQGLWNEFYFNLDPAATEENAKCPHYYTVEDDGLSQPWTIPGGWPAKVFVNPPYAGWRKYGIERWVEKGFRSARLGESAVVVMLLPVRSDTHWWQKYVMRADEIRFIEGRLRFGGASNPAPFPNAIVIWRDNTRDRPPRISSSQQDGSATI